MVGGMPGGIPGTPGGMGPVIAGAGLRTGTAIEYLPRLKNFFGKWMKRGPRGYWDGRMENGK